MTRARQSLYCHCFGRGMGFGAEFLYLLKRYAACRAAGIQFALQVNHRPEGFAIEHGWEDYFEQRFPQVDLGFLGRLNRPFFPGDSVPILKLLARVALRTLTPAQKFMFDPIEPMGSDAISEDDYWDGMQALAKELWCLNAAARRGVDRKLESADLDNEYIALHVRRGDKNTEAAYVELDHYQQAVAAIREHSPALPQRYYIASDDSRVAADLMHRLGADRVVNSGMLGPAEGYDQQRFNRDATRARYDATISFLADLEAIFRSAWFVGTSTSNIYYLTRYVRGNQRLTDLSG